MSNGEADASASTQWKYSPSTGLLTNKLDAAGKGAAYTYTADGRPLRTTWARSNAWKENTYDQRGLVRSNRYSSASMNVSYTYTAAGLPSLVSSALGFSTAYAYNDALVLTNETITGLDAPGSVFEIKRTVDARQRPSVMSLTQNTTNLTQVTYGYDAESRLSVIDHVDASVEYAYNGNYMTDCTIALSNGLTFTRSFVRDQYRKHLVNAVSNCFDGVSVSAAVYTHDFLLRRTNIIYTAQSGTNTLACSYNARSEVTGVKIDTNDYAYVYDNIGNSLYTSLNSVTNAYTINNLNQYKAITNLLDLSGYRLQHDADGNMVRLDDHMLTFDAENRLATYTFGMGSETGTLRTAYNQDHMGRRVKRLNQESKQKNPGGIVPLTYWHTNEVTAFVYDGWNLIHETIANTNGTADEIEYVWGLDLSGSRQGAGGVGGLLFEKRNGHIFIPCYDANGNVTSYVDETGAIRAYRVYDAFGNTVAKGGDMVDTLHFWYSTKYLDHDTGLYYYGYRYYLPLLQRWINRDPIEERGGVNLYEFCRNDAYNKFDYLGNVDVPQTISVKKCHAYLYIGHAKKNRPIKWSFPSDGSAYGGAITCWPSSNNPENEALRWPNAPFHEGHMFDTSTPFGKENSGKEKYSSWDMSNDSVPEHVYEGDPVRALQAMWSKEALDKIKETLFSKPHCCKIITFEIFVGKDMWLKNQIKLLVSKYNWQQGDTRRIKVYKGSEYED